jgi:hypothetical protein
VAENPDDPRHPDFPNWPLIPSSDEIIVPFLIAAPGDTSPVVEQWKRDHPDWFVAGTHPLPAAPRTDQNGPSREDSHQSHARSIAPIIPPRKKVCTPPFMQWNSTTASTASPDPATVSIADFQRIAVEANRGTGREGSGQADTPAPVPDVIDAGPAMHPQIEKS